MAYRAAVIGCGMIAGRFEDFSAPYTYSHTKAYRRSAAFGDLAFCDQDRGRAAELAVKVGGKAYSSLAELMVKHRPEVVSVCTPDNLHFPMIEQMLQEPHPPRVIFAEKPICNSRAELARLLQLESSCGSVVVVNHSRRFDVAHQRLKALLKSGELGSLVKVHVDYYGGWRHLGVHIVDILQYLFGATIEIDRVDYFCESKYADDPTLCVEGRIGNALLALEGFREDHYQILDMNILCQGGQIRITDFGKKIEVFRKTVNAERENVLVLDQAACETGMRDCMNTAVGLIESYLGSGNNAILEPYGLGEAQHTMNTLWKGSEKYATQS